MSTIREALTIALEHHQSGRLQGAEQIYRRILAVDPNHAEAVHLLGVIALQVGQYEAAVATIRQAIALKASEAVFHNNLGAAYRSQGNISEAVASYRQAIALKPGYAEAHNNLGNALDDLGDAAAAIDSYRRALKSRPDYPEALNNLGITLAAQGRRGEAIECYRKAIALRPDHAEALNSLGVALKEQGDAEAAADCYRRAIALKPDFAEAHNNLGNYWKEVRKWEEAAACYRRALELNRDYSEAHNNLGVVLKEVGRLDEAIECFRRSLDAKPDHWLALCSLTHELQHLCRWEGLAGLSRRIVTMVETDAEGKTAAVISPFSFLALPTPTTAEQQLHCARRWARQKMRVEIEAGKRRTFPQTSGHDRKLVVGYLSADFHAHATAYLLAELLEKHDRSRFTVIGYSCGPDDRSAMRQRLAAAFDRFVDVRDDSFVETARRIAADGIDILVDLKGYTADARTQVLALRPSPIQVNFLGYPGTMGAPFIDYILVDDYIVPPEQADCFDEKLVHLPDCYQVNDGRREIAARIPSRAECGLPEQGFVFCSFNNSYKITPDVFDVWMRLLRAVPGSVLWLLEGNAFVAPNLKREAENRGVAVNRLIFAPRQPLAEHLARHRLADLFLDTFPVNAHTTASDSLWAGCPVLTLSGETLVSRVAGSLLRTMGLPELITTKLEDYEREALRLATNPETLAAVRAKVAAGRTTSPLFDADRFARNIERAYRQMWEIHAAGELPRSFHVTLP